MLQLTTLSSATASLTVAAFDARSADAWVQTKPAENKAQFTGHPAEILRGLSKGDELTPIDVGSSTGVAFELEGTSGRLDAYRIENGIALVAPARSWWSDDVDARFTELLGAADDASELGEIEIESGRLAIVYMWLAQVKQAKELAVPAGGATSFGENNGGVVIDVEPGHYRVLRHELGDDPPLVAMFFLRA